MLRNAASKVMGTHWCWKSSRAPAASSLDSGRFLDIRTNFANIDRQPILADEVQTFKALITVHKVLQEGHPSTLREAMANRNWIDSLNRGMSGEGLRGYGPLIKEYVNFLLAKLSFHSQHPDFNGTFEYEEYISLKGINDPNEGYETISDLMQLQDRIEQFQKLIFSHFRGGGNNECRISALVPLVQESYGIYKFITSMLRAMHTSKSYICLAVLST